MAETVKASPGIVNDYLGLFVNRRAYYTMQSVRLHPGSGRYYFRRTKKNSGTAGFDQGDHPKALGWRDRSWFVSDQSNDPALEISFCRVGGINFGLHSNLVSHRKTMNHIDETTAPLYLEGELDRGGQQRLAATRYRLWPTKGRSTRSKERAFDCALS